MMGIVVAGRATHVRKAERQDLIHSSCGARFVAIRTRHSPMCPGQYEPGVAMFSNSEGRAMEVQYRMAVFTSVLVRRGGKLPVVGVFVAIGAGRKFHFVNRVFAGWNMALGAFHICMLPFQRVLGSGMFLDAKERRLPTFYRVAFRAFAFLGPRLELTFVRIRLMAVRAIRKGQRLLEISACMALHATYGCMLSQQRVFGF